MHILWWHWRVFYFVFCFFVCSATDAWDKRTNVSILERYFCEEVMNDDYKFSESGLYFAPPGALMRASKGL